MIHETATQEGLAKRDSISGASNGENSRDEGDEEYAVKCKNNPFLKKKMQSELNSLDRSVCERCHTMPDEDSENTEPLL